MTFTRTFTRRAVQVYPALAYVLAFPEDQYHSLQGLELPIAYREQCLYITRAAREMWRYRCRLREGEYTTVEPPRSNLFRRYWEAKEAVA